MSSQPPFPSVGARLSPGAAGLRSVIGTTLSLVLAAAIGAGCSTGTSPGKTVSGWFGAGDKGVAKGGDVFYAGSAGLNVHAEANASSPVVGRLSAGEKVVRGKQKEGFSQVEARRGAVKGWVVNSRLLRRPPAAKPAAAATTGSDVVEPDEPEATAENTTGEAPGSAMAEPAQAPEASEPAEAAAPAADEPAPKGLGASVFDPY